MFHPVRGQAIGRENQLAKSFNLLVAIRLVVIQIGDEIGVVEYPADLLAMFGGLAFIHCHELFGGRSESAGIRAAVSELVRQIVHTRAAAGIHRNLEKNIAIDGAQQIDFLAALELVQKKDGLGVPAPVPAPLALADDPADRDCSQNGIICKMTSQLIAIGNIRAIARLGWKRFQPGPGRNVLLHDLEHVRDLDVDDPIPLVFEVFPERPDHRAEIRPDWRHETKNEFRVFNSGYEHGREVSQAFQRMLSIRTVSRRVA
ncbi:MAG TPA: hypothetical protein VHX61_04005 [Rhizomicrobium sp.]|jgi:hypothetical protein|nr:hypothetical protein [Rhizomicrobium sp.]